MVRTAILTVLVGALLCGTAMAHPDDEYPRANYDPDRLFTGTIYVGYYSGVGLHFAGTFDNFAAGFPFAVRLGIGHSWRAAGDPLAARRVFIDANTNGTPTSNGTVWDGRFDLLYPMKLLSLQRSKLFGGVRYAKYSGYFEYTGANETFNVEGDTWGLGGGLETAFALSPLVDMTFSLGVDYFFKSELYGHGSLYRPDGDDVDPTASYTYKDADAAANQPELDTRLMIGLAYRF